MANLPGPSGLSLRGKLLLITLSVLVLGGVAGAWLVIHSYRDSMLDAAQASNEALAATIAEYGAAPLIFEDVAGAEAILGKLKSNHEVARAILLTQAGERFAHYERSGASDASDRASRLIAEKPVMHEGRLVGRLVLEATTTAVEQRIAAVAQRITIGIAVLIVLCALLALRLQLIITGPLARLASAMQRVGDKGELGARERYQGTDEIAVLYGRFNDMLDQLQQRSRERDRSQLWLRTLVESLPDQVLVFDAQGNVMDVRGEASQLPHLARGRALSGLMPPDIAKEMLAAVSRTLADGEPVRMEYQLGPEGQRFEAVLTPLEAGSAGDNWRVLAVSRDVTERDRLQSQFLRAQKLDAVGQLAGGIAHDFNNLLAGIVGYAQLIKFGRGGPEAGKEILQISERASDLVKQLLRFSRKDPSSKRPTDVNELVRRVEGILRHTLDPRINLAVDLSDGPCTVHGDPSQLESAVLNLAVNARDAMPSGGELKLQARVVTLDALAISALDCPLTPGEHVEISVEDTGGGIPEELLGHIFEPFFTTKEAGKGTGLGLAAVYGTVQAHRGGIHIRSQPGKGSVFRLFLPQASGQAVPIAVTTPTRGSGRLLLVDDERVVRETAQALLIELGYSVEAFARPRDAVAFFERNHAAIDGVLLDMVMPQLHGVEVVERLRQIQPDVRILIASGFLGLGDHMPQHLSGLPILRKPFTLHELAQAVHELLGRQESAEATRAHA